MWKLVDKFTLYSWEIKFNIMIIDSSIMIIHYIMANNIYNAYYMLEEEQVLNALWYCYDNVAIDANILRMKL